MADSVAIFAEGTFEEQIQELVSYIAGSRSEEDRASFIRPFQEALRRTEDQLPLKQDVERKKKVLQMVLAQVKDIGNGSDKEIEGFFNLLFAHIINTFDSSISEHLSPILKTIVSAPAARTHVKYRILSNLFNSLPRSSSLKLNVYLELLRLAVAEGQIDALEVSQPNVERWIQEWSISDEAKNAFLKELVNALESANKLTEAYNFNQLFVRRLPASSPESEIAAANLIANSLRLPSVYDFDPLLKIDAVVHAKDHLLFSLLHIFLNDGKPELDAWLSKNGGELHKFRLDGKELDRKIRQLTLASLSFKNLGQSVPYSTIAKAIDIPVEEVEKWVIDVIRAGLLSGKLSQTTQTLLVTRATARTFEREQWERLANRLVVWKAGLSTILETVANARRQGGEPQLPAVTPAA